MGDDQILEIVMLQFVTGICLIPVADQFFAQTGFGMRLDQNPLFIPGMLEEDIEMFFLEMQMVENVGQFFLVDGACGRHGLEQVVVMEQPGRQHGFRIRFNFEKGNLVDGASDLPVIINDKFNISLEIATSRMGGDHTYCHDPLQEINCGHLQLEVKIKIC